MYRNYESLIQSQIQLLTLLRLDIYIFNNNEYRAELFLYFISALSSVLKFKFSQNVSLVLDEERQLEPILSDKGFTR